MNRERMVKAVKKWFHKRLLNDNFVLFNKLLLNEKIAAELWDRTESFRT